MVYRETPDIARRKAELRERLLQSAESLVRSGGFKALTIQALAADAGVSVGSVYRYFKNKDQLATEVFEHATRRELRAVAAALTSAESPASCIAAGTRVFAERAFMAPRFAWALIAEPVDAAVDVARLEYRRSYTALFERVVARGVEQGQFAPQRPGVTAAALVGALAESLLGPLRASEEQSEAELINELCRLSLRAVGGDPQP
ncbi:MAG: TetR/AcrR family transcriptional regulator [Spongiibacter sp.]|uniref:TetR/AcrR family transcriptional regulator n=1 Tax=Spongiibacter thalassae TaxID=2721624 RepID=A0ABX1GDN7_9GAMM|nr:TetR/AcrR family transcriptional regulator [Spongiibacter thalassae]NKI17271.1 TetR/AcrR family transcriptional regulator [Spongiibacter thalassae]